jgi:hypothetical protein
MRPGPIPQGIRARQDELGIKRRRSDLAKLQALVAFADEREARIEAGESETVSAARTRWNVAHREQGWTYSTPKDLSRAIERAHTALAP